MPPGRRAPATTRVLHLLSFSFLQNQLRRRSAGRSGARSIARAMCWLLLLDCVMCIGLAVWSRSIAYDNQMRQSAIAGHHLAQAATDHVESALNKVAWTLDGIADRVQTSGVEGMQGDSLRRFMLTRVQLKDSPLHGLFVVDRDGRHVLATVDRPRSGAGSARHPWFVHHRTHPGGAIHVGHPVLNHASGQWILTVSRRIDDRQGNFAGAVLAMIPVQYFQDYYARLTLGPQGMLVLATADGTVVARTPASALPVGASVQASPIYRHALASGKDSGSIMLPTASDGIERLHSYRRSKAYPLLVDAALAKGDILAGWWRVTWQEGAVLGCVMAGAYLVALWLIGQLRVRERLERELRSAQAALESQNAALERMAHTDGLTGLYNRRHLDERMAAEVARAARERASLSLIMIDVDFFKRYNDTYGHAAGDDCLRTVARVLAATVNRPADLAARFGGEEFAVLLPNTSAEGARQLAEAICRGVYATGLEHRASDYGTLSISAGVATVVPAPGEGVRALIEAADAALYQAKAAGRNTVHA